MINWKNFILTFIPIFVAMGSLGNMPIFMSLTDGLRKKQKQKVIRDAIVTASLAIMAFLLIGKGIFGLLGVTMPDFMVGGGLLLLVIAMSILLNVKAVKETSQKEVGIVPLGTPLIAGPAVFTTSLILISIYGISATIVSLILNIAITGVVFMNAGHIAKKLGAGGTKALSKVTAVFLTAIAVMMIRSGVIEIIKSAL